MQFLLKTTGFLGFVLGIIESPIACLQLGVFALGTISSFVTGKPYESLHEIIRTCPYYSILGFHRLPSAYASPLFFVVYYGALALGKKIREARERRLESKQTYQKAELQRLADIQRAQQKELWDKEHIKQQHLALQNHLVKLASDSARLAANLPALASDAMHGLNIAEQEYREGVFPMFWDAIEAAANKLATFNNDVKCIVMNALQHKEQSAHLNGGSPPFRIGIDTLPDATHIADKMHLIVRRAQKNADFAKIYEMRRTNQLLVSGFSSLGQAIADLSQDLQISMRDLETSLLDGISNVAQQQRESAADALSEMKLGREQAKSDAAELRESADRNARASAHRADQESAARREHERKEEEMLDDIRRRGKPVPPGFRDGQY